MFYRKIRDWLTVKDYETAKHKSAEEVAARYSRGNVAVQRGWFLNRTALNKLSLAADRAMKRMQKKNPA